jgi:hypothetical protein
MLGHILAQFDRIEPCASLQNLGCCEPSIAGSNLADLVFRDVENLRKVTLLLAGKVQALEDFGIFRPECGAFVHSVIAPWHATIAIAIIASFRLR